MDASINIASLSLGMIIGNVILLVIIHIMTKED